MFKVPAAVYTATLRDVVQHHVKGDARNVDIPGLASVPCPVDSFAVECVRAQALEELE